MSSKQLSEQITDLINKHVPAKDLRISKGTDWSRESRFRGKKTEWTMDNIALLKLFAKDLYKKEREFYYKNMPDRKFCATPGKNKLTEAQGVTLCRAYVHICNGSPFHSLEFLLDMIDFINLDAPQHFSTFYGQIRALMKWDYLPGTAVARSFEDHDLVSLVQLWKMNLLAGESELMIWYFEDQLREAYETCVKKIAYFLAHESNNEQRKACKFLEELLFDHPHQSENIIVDSLCRAIQMQHTENDLVSKTVKRLLLIYPGVRLTIVETLSEIITSKSHNIDKLIGTAKVLVNFRFTSEDWEIALMLLSTWFQTFFLFFKKNPPSMELFSCLLAGIKKSCRTLKTHPDNTEVMAVLYDFHASLISSKIAEDEKSIQILNVIKGYDETIKKNFYRVLFMSIANYAWENPTRSINFQRVAYEGCIEDNSWMRLKAITKRLLQVALHKDIGFCCALVMLVSRIMSRSKQYGSSDLSVISSEKQVKSSEDDEYFERFTGLFYELLIFKNYCHMAISGSAKEFMKNNFVEYDGNIERNFSVHYALTIMDLLSRETESGNFKGEPIKCKPGVIQEKVYGEGYTKLISNEIWDFSEIPDFYASLSCVDEISDDEFFEESEAQDEDDDEEVEESNAEAETSRASDGILTAEGSEDQEMEVSSNNNEEFIEQTEPESEKKIKFTQGKRPASECLTATDSSNSDDSNSSLAKIQIKKTQRSAKKIKKN